MNKKTLVILLVVVVVLAAGGVAAWQFTKSKSSAGQASARFGGANFAAGQTGTGQRGARAASANFGGASGNVLSKDNNSLTIELANGGSAIVFYSGSTRVSKTIDAQAADLAVGQMVSVRGTKGADGTISANSVQIRPAGSTNNGAGGQQNRIGGQYQGRSPQTGDTVPGGAAQPGNSDSGFVNGTISAVSGNNLTVKNSNGNEQAVTLASGVKITQMASATIDDVSQGTNVTIVGQKNPDGSINAQMIQIGVLANIPAGGRINGGQPGANQAAPSAPAVPVYN
jgi:hypothetical protein